MKKLLFVLAIVAVYGFSIASASANVVISEKAEISIVADDKAPDTEKGKTTAKKETKKAETKGAACGETTEKKAEAACGTAEKAACGTAAKAGCGTAEKAACGEKK